VDAYSVEIRRSAVEELEGVEPHAVRAKIVRRIRSLAAEPRPHGAEKLAAGRAAYRLRQGDHRIVYEIDDDAKRVTIVKIGHRREVYR
jgi:mRNA interferase RelE/StbE